MVGARANASWGLRGARRLRQRGSPQPPVQGPCAGGRPAHLAAAHEAGAGAGVLVALRGSRGEGGPQGGCAAGPAALHSGSSSLPPKLSPARTFFLHLPSRVSQLWPMSGQVHPSMQAFGLHWPGRPWASVRRGPAGAGVGWGPGRVPCRWMHWCMHIEWCVYHTQAGSRCPAGLRPPRHHPLLLRGIGSWVSVSCTAHAHKLTTLWRRSISRTA